MTPFMTRYNFGDVLFLDYPFADREDSKRRPAVVISSELFHRHKKDVIVLAITSQLTPVGELGEILIKDWQHAGLPKPSILKATIATIVSDRVIRRFGMLSDYDTQSLKQLLSKIIT